MLSCLCNESSGSSHSPMAPVVEFISNEKDATHGAVLSTPTTATFLQGMPLPLLDGQALLADEESTTLVNPSLSLSFSHNPFPSNHQKSMFLCFPYFN